MWPVRRRSWTGRPRTGSIADVRGGAPAAGLAGPGRRGPIAFRRRVGSSELPANDPEDHGWPARAQPIGSPPSMPGSPRASGLKRLAFRSVGALPRSRRPPPSPPFARASPWPRAGRTKNRPEPGRPAWTRWPIAGGATPESTAFEPGITRFPRRPIHRDPGARPAVGLPGSGSPLRRMWHFPVSTAPVCRLARPPGCGRSAFFFLTRFCR